MQKLMIIYCSFVILFIVGRTFAKDTNDVSSTVAGKNDMKLPSDAEFQDWKQFSVSRHSDYGEKSKSLSITTNDVVLIKRPSGAVAVVQFTSFGAFTNSGPLTASYRWRGRSSPSQPVQSGTGQVCEDYDRTPSADGKTIHVTPGADHDVTVKAGDIWIDWSYRTESSGYLYYYASQAKIEILGADAFGKDL